VPGLAEQGLLGPAYCLERTLELGDAAHGRFEAALFRIMARSKREGVGVEEPHGPVIAIDPAEELPALREAFARFAVVNDDDDDDDGGAGAGAGGGGGGSDSDSGGLGTLSRAALLSLLRSVGQPPLDDEADMDATLAEIDTTGTGRVTFGDFCTEMVARQTNSDDTVEERQRTQTSACVAGVGGNGS
jgi:hypothetical protein